MNNYKCATIYHFGGAWSSVRINARTHNRNETFYAFHKLKGNKQKETTVKKKTSCREEDKYLIRHYDSGKDE